MTFSPKVLSRHLDTEWAIMSIHHVLSLTLNHAAFAPGPSTPLPERHWRVAAILAPSVAPNSSKIRGDDTGGNADRGWVEVLAIMFYQRTFLKYK